MKRSTLQPERLRLITAGLYDIKDTKEDDYTWFVQVVTYLSELSMEQWRIISDAVTTGDNGGIDEVYGRMIKLLEYLGKDRGQHFGELGKLVYFGYILNPSKEQKYRLLSKLENFGYRYNYPVTQQNFRAVDRTIDLLFAITHLRYKFIELIFNNWDGFVDSHTKKHRGYSHKKVLYSLTHGFVF